ncbi:MAG: PIN domain-containing protein [Betaproteobacteria bacterium]|nr:PIN domain-containing protein [Betaproteobacteria bacterium]
MSEKSTSVVDANAILALLLGGERVHFHRARAFFEPVREGKTAAYVPAAVLAECVYVLTRVYKVTRADAATKLLSLLDYRGVITESPAVRQALTLYRDLNVDFVDALVAATARERNWGVFSFDRDLERLTK